MPGDRRPARPRGPDPAARRRTRLDTLPVGVVLATAGGFRFLSERHFLDPSGPDGWGVSAETGMVDTIIALEVVLIPLALALMILAARGAAWRRRAAAAPSGHLKIGMVTLAAAALLRALGASPAPLGSATAPHSASGWLLACLLLPAEELLRRGFLLNEIAALLGPGSAASWTAAGLLAITDGFAHAPAGTAAVLRAGAADFVFGASYLLGGRTLRSPVLAGLLARAAEEIGL